MLLMGRLKGLCNLLRNRQGFIDRDWTFSDAVREGRSLDQLEDERLRIPAVDVADVGMIQRREDFRFALNRAGTISFRGFL